MYWQNFVSLRGGQSLFQSGLQLIGWGKSTLWKVICFNRSPPISVLTSFNHLHRNIQNNVWPNIWAPRPSQVDTLNQPSQIHSFKNIFLNDGKCSIYPIYKYENCKKYIKKKEMLILPGPTEMDPPYYLHSRHTNSIKMYFHTHKWYHFTIMFGSGLLFFFKFSKTLWIFPQVNKYFSPSWFLKTAQQFCLTMAVVNGFSFCSASFLLFVWWQYLVQVVLSLTSWPKG